MVILKNVLKVIIIVLNAIYAILGFLILAVAIHICYKNKHLEWTTALLFYLGIEAGLTASYSTFAALKENSRLLLHCAAMILISIILKFVILLILYISSKSFGTESNPSLNCKEVFSIYICERDQIFLTSGYALIIFEVVCLVVTCYYIKRIPEIYEF